MTIRLARQEDLEEIKPLYVDTIHAVCSAHYDENQRNAWASTAQNEQRWQDMMTEQYVWVVEIDRQIAGFATLKDVHYIDFFYVHKDFQRKGIARALFDRIEVEAKGKGEEFLTADVSITTKPFFERNGFIVLTEQQNYRNDVVLVNYKMKKEYSY